MTARRGQYVASAVIHWSTRCF